MQLFSSFRGVLKWFGQKVMTGNILRKFVFDGFSLIHGLLFFEDLIPRLSEFCH